MADKMREALILIRQGITAINGATFSSESDWANNAQSLLRHIDSLAEGCLSAPQPAAPSEDDGYKDGWLARQVKKGRNDVNNWPEWIKKSSGSNAEKYSPYKRKEIQEEAAPSEEEVERVAEFKRIKNALENASAECGYAPAKVHEREAYFEHLTHGAIAAMNNLKGKPDAK